MTTLLFVAVGVFSVHTARLLCKAARRIVGVLLAANGEIRCPLCVGTERAALLYEPDDLRDHSTTHSIEDLWEWTREHAPADLVAALDDAYQAIQAVSTETTEMDLDGGGCSWLCLRCDAYKVGFADEDAAMRDRLATHRCPL